MANPKLPIVTHPRTQCFRALVHKIRGNPELKRLVRTWRVWEGNPDDAAPPTVAEMPWARLTPVPVAVSSETIGLSNSPFNLRIEVWVDGLHADDILNLWGAFELAIFPRDGTVQTLLQQTGMLGVLRLVQPAFQPTEIEGQQAWTATGSVEVGFLSNTRI